MELHAGHPAFEFIKGLGYFMQIRGPQSDSPLLKTACELDLI